MTDRPQDRRAFGRKESAIAATAIVPGKGAVRCTIANFSERGALLVFESQFSASGNFRLVCEEPVVDAICQIRHVGPAGVGVQIVGGNAAAFAVPFRTATTQGLTVVQNRPQSPTQPISGRDLRRLVIGAAG
jgi:hypothetical protein